MFTDSLLEPEEAFQLPCFENPGPWQDTPDTRVKQRAAARCLDSCEQVSWCEGQRLATVAEFGSAVGVWAGKVWTHQDYRKLHSAA